MTKKNNDVTAWDKKMVRAWWREVGAVRVPGGPNLKVRDGMETPMSIVVAYLLAHGLPVSPMRFVNREPRSLMLKDVIVGEGNRAFEVTEDPYWDERLKEWTWEQRRVYCPVAHSIGEEHAPRWVTEKDGWKIVVFALARRNNPENKGVNHAKEMIAKVIRRQEPQEWSGRIITLEWIERNGVGDTGEADFIERLARLAMLGHSDI